MNIKKETAIKLSWQLVATLIGKEITRILQHPIHCIAKADDHDYWAISFYQYAMPLSELAELLENVEATSEEIMESFPAEGVKHVHSLSQTVSSKFLSRCLNCRWEKEFPAENELWLVGTKVQEKEPLLLKIGDELSIDLRCLKCKDDLFHYLCEYGATHESLMDFCEDYRTEYHNELCWAYPISDGKHLGTYLILVQEGVLSLPYDSANEEDYEIFALEDAHLFDAASMQTFIEEWNSFSVDLWHAMTEMKKYLQKKEDPDEHEICSK